jgi:citrate lyase beta subunit
MNAPPASEEESSMNEPSRYVGIRSLLESPIMDDRKWGKVPDIPTDAILVDLEDSVPPPLKDEARGRVVETLRDPSHLGGKVLVARPNHLSTPWGRDDLDAMAEVGVTCLAYPKCQSLEELLEVQEILRAGGAEPDIFAVIETAGSVLDAARIAANDKVVAIGIGAGDLSVDLGVSLYDDAGELNPVFAPAKVQVSLAAAAFDRLAVDFAYAPDLRDLPEIGRRFAGSRSFGFTTGATFYPPHVEVINDVFSPSDADVALADEVIGLYKGAVAAGHPAVTLSTGRTILVHDYHKALKVRARVDAIEAMSAGSAA